MAVLKMLHVLIPQGLFSAIANQSSWEMVIIALV